MSTKLYTAPTVEPVLLEDLKDHLRIATSDEDALLAGLLATARGWLEMYTGRAFITQTWELALPGFPVADAIELPYPPLASVTSVTYYDTDQTAATMTASDYIVDTYSQPGQIVLGYNKTWPTTTLRPVNGVVIRYVCGYGAAGSSVPERIRQAVRLVAGHLYENREESIESAMGHLPLGALDLAGIDRIFTA